MLYHLAIYLGSFVAIWIGSGLIVSILSKFSTQLRISQFVLSFFVLGILTSTPELAVGLTAISKNDPEIFVGNLLGGIPVIFLFIIPILAILGNGIKLKHDFEDKTFFLSCVIILSPFLLILDKKLGPGEGVLFISMYLALLVVIHRKTGIIDKIRGALLRLNPYSVFDILRLLAGVGLVFISSTFIVEKTIYFSEFLHISPFYISLLVLSLGTNLPELSIAIRAVYSGKKDVAFGDYVGSAAANTLLLGIFTLLSNGEVLTANNFLATYYFIAVGLWLFYIFSMSKRSISRKEGFVLLTIYILFVIFEVSTVFK